MKRITLLIFAAGTHFCAAQGISSKSNEVSLDYSDSKKNYATSFPKIIWMAPEGERTFLKDGKLPIHISVKAKNGLKSVNLTIRNKATGEVRGSTSIPISED